MRGLDSANACVSSDVNFCGSVSCPHLGESTAVCAGNKRVLPWQKPDWVTTHAVFPQFLASPVEWGMLAKTGRTYQKYERVLWQFEVAYRIGLLFGFAFKGCRRVCTDMGSFSRILKLRKALLMQVVHSNGGKKFMRETEVHILSRIPGKQQPLVTFTAYSTVVWKTWCVTGWHCCSQRLVSLSK